MKKVHNNSTIECSAAIIISRKISHSSFIEMPSIGRCFTYKCTRNSEATILKELTPKEPLYNENSHLNIDTKLECENMFVAVSQKKPYKFHKINHSGRHKAQTLNTNKYTYAKISQQLHNIPLCDPSIDIVLIKKNK